MKTVILAGGFGTRLAEYTGLLPKPMIMVGDRPIIWHIMDRYARFGHKDFVLALGYKSEVIKHYFLNYQKTVGDLSVNLKSGLVTNLSADLLDWNVTLVETGLQSMTGGRVKRVEPHLDGETFLLTYGDGLADIDIDALIKFHKTQGKLVTITAVRPVARFGELVLTNDAVSAFKEKPQVDNGWINGGFFVIEPDFLKVINSDSTVLEQEPLEWAASNGELAAYRHHGYWQCMDTKRDHDQLEALFASGRMPWALK